MKHFLNFFLVVMVVFFVSFPLHASASTNINTANQETLMTLSSIGEVKE